MIKYRGRPWLPVTGGSWLRIGEEVSQLRVIWGRMEHNLHHGRELSFVLGAYGLPAPDM